MEKIKHKPIIHRKCGLRMPDRGEEIRRGFTVKGEAVCTCHDEHSTVFSSRPTPPDLQMYDKILK